MSEKLASTIKDIAKGIAAGSFRSEAEISRGVVQQILHELGWPVFNMQVVAPEFKIGDGAKKVDYALCHPPGKAAILLEVKDLGKADGKGQRQLFEYCFHQGVPIAVLTDDRIWSFFYPSGQGSYEERRFARIDLLDDTPPDAASILTRYLDIKDVRSKVAKKRAERDYEEARSRIEAASKFAFVWHKLLSEPAKSLLLDVFLEEVEKEMGARPDPEQAAAFIRRQSVGGDSTLATPTGKPVGGGITRPPRPEPPENGRLPFNGPHAPKQHSFTFQGRTKEFKKAVDLFENVFHTFASMDPDFCKRYSERYYGKKLKYVARTKEELYPTDPHLRRAARLLPGGWWLGTNVSNRGKIDRIKQACHVMGLKFGQDLMVEM